MEQHLKISFDSGQIADAVCIEQPTELFHLLRYMGLSTSCPTLVIVGGASNMSPDDFPGIKNLFVEVLAPIAENLGAYVVDGGTDAGVMRLMGEARRQIGAKFPLIGVVPKSKVGLLATSTDSIYLEPNHSHFVLVPGSNWGDESPWIAQLATLLADGKPSITILLNGGEITFVDAFHSIQAGRLVVVVAGSGRTADILAMALQGKTTNARAIELGKSGILHYIKLDNLQNSWENLAKIIKGLLST
ncbi:hypothetical protein [Nostoc sp. TCL26-01]|uniref:hypothetical protein n=1 Tax=Nostoc sp. TCL26-01 TaxID=2576904 RepID=UPI0015C07A22|nr:hypothetical protein [Nostoc sp. TCL26-01]QLE56575.1 hypothetical protein FD725_14305 [Nostoc sp. TCL26-01]